MRGDAGTPWFVVLPDAAAAAPVAAVVRPAAVHEIEHPSGRPWLLGNWAAEEMAVGAATGVKVAVLGQHDLDAERLHRVARSVGSVSDLNTFAGTIDGSVHLMASAAGRVRVQGTLTGLRRVFHTRLGHCDLASDRPDVLAHLTDAALDTDVLAYHLLSPSMLGPITHRSLWRGVSGLPPRDYLVLDDAERPARTVRWWRPPAPTVPLSEGAELFGEALSRAVDVRARTAVHVSSDLGGFDSTTLCCLAARRGPVVACTIGAHDPAVDDLPWARHTVDVVPGITHVVLAGRQLPAAYDGLSRLDEPPDAPNFTHVARACYTALWRSATRHREDGFREHGVHEHGVHFAGLGGDEVAGGTLNHVYDMLRTPWTSRRSLRGFMARGRWPLRSMAALWWDRRSYGRWLAEEVADKLLLPLPSTFAPPHRWGDPSRMPPWASAEAVASVRATLRELADAAEPWSPHHGQHGDLDMLFGTAQDARYIAHAARRFGITLALPYYDDRVVEAALSIRTPERVTPWAYKPLLTAATKGLIPDSVFARTTKAEGSHGLHTGWSANRSRLLALFDESLLATSGLIDVEELHRAFRAPLAAFDDSHIFDSTLGCETWLRSHADAEPPWRRPGRPGNPSEPLGAARQS